MKTLLSVVIVTIFLAMNANSEELPLIKVAVVHFDRVMNTPNFYQRARLLFANKEALDAMRKANNDIKTIYDEVVVTEDPAKLGELENKLQFLKRKANILRQGVDDGNRDMQAPLREFVIKQFGNKYNLILTETQMLDRCMFKKNVEVVDISDEVADQFYKYVNQLVGEEPIPPAPAKPGPVRPGSMVP